MMDFSTSELPAGDEGIRDPGRVATRKKRRCRWPSRQGVAGSPDGHGQTAGLSSPRHGQPRQRAAPGVTVRATRDHNAPTRDSRCASSRSRLPAAHALPHPGRYGAIDYKAAGGWRRAAKCSGYTRPTDRLLKQRIWSPRRVEFRHRRRPFSTCFIADLRFILAAAAAGAPQSFLFSATRRSRLADVEFMNKPSQITISRSRRRPSAWSRALSRGRGKVSALLGC